MWQAFFGTSEFNFELSDIHSNGLTAKIGSCAKKKPCFIEIYLFHYIVHPSKYCSTPWFFNVAEEFASEVEMECTLL